jgi:hypothetical protein
MWERSARHNPLSLRSRFYLDHRPILPQDPTLSSVRKSYGDYTPIYFYFDHNGQMKILLSNNIPAKDREQMKELYWQHAYTRSILNRIALIPAIFSVGFLYYRVKLPYKLLYPVGLYLSYKVFQSVILGRADFLMSEVFSHYYLKYHHLSVSKISELEDNRRKHFKLDTSSYYRETVDDIQHGGHHEEGAHGGHGHHDTSTYYGPHPVIYFI